MSGSRKESNKVTTIARSTESQVSVRSVFVVFVPSLKVIFCLWLFEVATPIKSELKIRESGLFELSRLSASCEMSIKFGVRLASR